ncbi:site-specific recombinase XerD [Cupriavidus gilardii J11]|uniref:Site-specific recombinase XerD n=1 Tax=Cupriavidus gilardii J11 TaxID=936133 RepID=A0A562BSY6_9BURK|nr:tyrosine-type recombinase/integrase [Cupriavidus gilardii]TWG87910.1 site-specific recombinase XerD [Cupriavidus gilardii J11]
MKGHYIWLANPSLAYRDWQHREAAGADRRPFSERSRVQHQAMFENFRKHLLCRGATILAFGSADIEAFWQTAEGRSYSQATRMRYLKLLDRLCRHLVFEGVRLDNPTTALLAAERWPNQDPTPQYLGAGEDERLQRFLATPADNLADLRNHAIVAILLATGITAAELRRARLQDLHLAAASPYLTVRAHGSRDARTVHVAAFAVPPLRTWIARREALPVYGDLLFTLTAEGGPVTDMSLGRIVAAALNEIGYAGAEPSPRTLRNTYCRRQLLAGRTRDEIGRALGLSSSRTCDRIAATIAKTLTR